METKQRLGRGLDALLGSLPGEGTAGQGVAPSQSVALDRIQVNPFQPRKNFDEDELGQLCESIRNHGILQPLAVRQMGDNYQLIAGERRLRAAQIAGLLSVPVHIVDFNDQQVLEAALVENIQRSDLNAIEKAQGFKEYLDRYQMTQEELAKRLGMDRTSISNLVNLLHLPQEVQDAVRSDQINLGHAKILKGLGDPEKQIALCKEIMLKGYSVKALELVVKQLKNDAGIQPKAAESAEPPPEKTAHVTGIEDELRQKLTVRVQIKLKARDKGQIVLGFESNDDFERILEALRRVG